MSFKNGAFEADPHIFPADPRYLKTRGLPIRVMATTKMTKGLLREMLQPTKQLNSLRNVANRDPYVRLLDVHVCGYDTINSLSVFKRDKWIFQPHTLFGVSSHGQLVQLRILPTQSDLPTEIRDIIPSRPSQSNIPDFNSFEASLQVDTCLNCEAPPLGKDQLCARCLLLAPRFN